MGAPISRKTGRDSRWYASGAPARPPPARHLPRKAGEEPPSRSLLRRFLHPRRQRLGAGPRMLGDVEQDALGAVELDLEAADPLRIGLVHVVLAAERLDLLGGLVDIL